MWIYRNRHIKWVHRENYKSLVKSLGSCDNLPLLSDLLDIIPPSKILFIEIKSLDRVDIMMKKIYKLIGDRSNVWLRIYWKKLLLATKAYSSFNIASALISANSFRLKDAQKYRVKMFSPFFLITPISLVRRRQQQGFYMVPWTVNRSYFMNKYFQASVDGILTDKLVKAQQIRNKYQNKYY